MKRLKLLASLICVSFVLNAHSADQSAPADLGTNAYEIVKRSVNSDLGFKNSEADAVMVLRNAAGMESSRSLSMRTLEVQDEDLGDKSLIIFSSPADVDGTALLSHAKILEPDNQWLFLPALKRTKRISSANKSGPFVGSEFAFEDLTADELKKFEYKYLREEKCGEFVCDVVQRIPLYKNSGYTQQEAWIDQSVFQLRKINYYDRKDDLLKTLQFDGYKVFQEKFYRPHVLTMINHQTGKSTVLTYSNYKFDVGLEEGDFVKKVLRRLN